MKQLWFSCPYQGSWFSPSELMLERTQNKRFRWGATNWRLRPPQDRKQELEAAVVEAQTELVEFLNHCRKAGYVV